MIQRKGVAMKKKRQGAAVPYLFLLPFLILSVIFTLVPMIYVLWISFHEMSFLNISNSKFVGWDNYKSILHDEVFSQAIINNMKLIFIAVPLIICISLGLAVLLNSKIKFRSFLRSAYYFPYVVSPIAMGVIIVQLFSKDNFIVKALGKLGVEGVSWYTKMPYAFYLIVLIVVWSQIGFYMVLYLSGLQNISEEYYEAARIDGATKWKQFRYITLPLLKPTTYLVVFMCMLSVLQIFDQPYVISTTGGASAGSPGNGTLTMVMYIYEEAFRYREMGQASAAAFIVFLMIFVVSLVQNIFLGKEKS